MPASHDAGMSVLNGHTGGANEQNTVTQNLDIGGQLNSGARYFDIRPVIASGGFATGHYSDVSGVWQGGNGQSIDDIISRINSFLDRNQELVILSLSHTLDTDNGYQKFSQGQWNQLLWKLSGLKYRYVAPAGTSDLSKLKLRDFIGAGPKVLLILDGDAAKVNLGAFARQGFYNSSQLSVFNTYSDTDNRDKMISDQLAKLKSRRPNTDAGLF
ncbi:MAG: hypothetical protein M1813_001666 [Trichoglossum hirsutum]|nr:MAG: hypothetical protein M1813_001666 [Trichoglossum hirsutum]